MNMRWWSTCHSLGNEVGTPFWFVTAGLWVANAYGDPQMTEFRAQVDMEAFLVEGKYAVPWRTVVPDDSLCKAGGLLSYLFEHTYDVMLARSSDGNISSSPGFEALLRGGGQAARDQPTSANMDSDTELEQGRSMFGVLIKLMNDRFAFLWLLLFY